MLFCLGEDDLENTGRGNAELVMATISKRRRNEASILVSLSILKRNEPAFLRTCKHRSEPCLFYTLERSKRSEFSLFEHVLHCDGVESFIYIIK